MRFQQLLQQGSTVDSVFRGRAAYWVGCQVPDRQAPDLVDQFRKARREGMDKAKMDVLMELLINIFGLTDELLEKLWKTRQTSYALEHASLNPNQQTWLARQVMKPFQRLSTEEELPVEKENSIIQQTCQILTGLIEQEYTLSDREREQLLAEARRRNQQRQEASVRRNMHIGKILQTLTRDPQTPDEMLAKIVDILEEKEERVARNVLLHPQVGGDTLIQTLQYFHERAGGQYAHGLLEPVLSGQKNAPPVKVVEYLLKTVEQETHITRLLDWLKIRPGYISRISADRWTRLMQSDNPETRQRVSRLLSHRTRTEQQEKTKATGPAR